MEAVNLAANQVRGGAGMAYIAGGVEMMSRVPMGSDGAAIAVDPSIAMKTATSSRKAFQRRYHRHRIRLFPRRRRCAGRGIPAPRQGAAWAEGRFARSIVPVVTKTACPSSAMTNTCAHSTDMQSLGALKPSFKDMGEVMPGFDKSRPDEIPASGADQPHPPRGQLQRHRRRGRRRADRQQGIRRKMGIKPRARIKATCKIGTDPTIMLTGPVPATQKILADSGMSIGDIDLFEVNEAFASVVLRFMQAFNVDASVVNVNGGSIAMGHPLGRHRGHDHRHDLLDELERTGKGTGLATLACIASGMGAATIIERV
jgi:acetyl-CoA C-acetyltransferase